MSEHSTQNPMLDEVQGAGTDGVEVNIRKVPTVDEARLQDSKEEPPLEDRLVEDGGPELADEEDEDAEEPSEGAEEKNENAPDQNDTPADPETEKKDEQPVTVKPARKPRKKSEKSPEQKAAAKDITAKCRVYGHNGLEVGQRFKTRAEIREKGGHSELQAGVCAGEKGAYAIVVADAPYRWFNRDYRDKIHFAATGANKVGKVGAEDSRWVKALNCSAQADHPDAKSVRVFRGARATRQIENEYRWFLLDKKAVGFRYDGLYDVTEKVWAGPEGG